MVTANETSFVHLSWQGAASYDLEHARVAVRQTASITRAFKVNIAGIGIFTGKKPVLFLNVIKNRKLLELHEVLWDRLMDSAKDMNGFYSPVEWVPHITLTYGMLLPGDLSCAVAELMYEPFTAELEIDNLAFIFLQDGMVGIDSRFELQPA
ncbi:2'-5' RNA ligase family protein [Longilinea arvoryzae]|nr:2'-5' RNA ligase family protein [Longilinea arvoryzae]